MKTKNVELPRNIQPDGRQLVTTVEHGRLQRYQVLECGRRIRLPPHQRDRTMAYRIIYTNGTVDDTNYPTQDAALAEVGRVEGWASPVASDDFALGNGNSYAVEVYESDAHLNAHPDGDPQAPRITEA